MVTSLAAVGAKKVPKPTSDNAMGYLIAGVVGIWLLKSACRFRLGSVARYRISDKNWNGLQLLTWAMSSTGGIQGNPKSV